ncbi:MAG: hypothetical protein QOF57_2483 [Frankiaceae bacterium]|nr:hypothetical protein [Frankiaceae bacterium]
MSDAADALRRELRALRIRVRESPAQWFAAAAPPFATRDDAAFHVVQEIARESFAVAFPGRPAPPVMRLPSLALADQLDVVTDELLHSMDDENDAVTGPLLAEVLLHRWHLDGSAPGPASTAAAAEATGVGDLRGWQRLCDARTRTSLRDR